MGAIRHDRFLALVHSVRALLAIGDSCLGFVSVRLAIIAPVQNCWNRGWRGSCTGLGDCHVAGQVAKRAVSTSWAGGISSDSDIFVRAGNFTADRKVRAAHPLDFYRL